MAWQLPHEPFDENFLKEQFLSDDGEPKRRIDENITDVPMNEYLDSNYNSLGASSWNDLFQSNNVTYSSLWDDSTRFAYVFFLLPFTMENDYHSSLYLTEKNYFIPFH